jgi:hypothetical protein
MQPSKTCLRGLQEAPCPLFGGEQPAMEDGMPAGSYHGDDKLATKPGPSFKYGVCPHCRAELSQRDGGELQIRRRPT